MAAAAAAASTLSHQSAYLLIVTLSTICMVELSCKWEGWKVDVFERCRWEMACEHF